MGNMRVGVIPGASENRLAVLARFVPAIGPGWVRG